VDDASLRQRLVSLGGGSAGFALQLADAALLDSRRQLLDALAHPGFDAVALAKEWNKFAEAAGKDTAAHRGRARLLLRLLIDFLTDALAVGEGAAPGRSEIADQPALTALAARTTPEVLMAALERCLEADEQLGHYVQTALVLEALLDALAQRLA
jgi:hypothetical protein